MNANHDGWDDADSLAECGRIPTSRRHAPTHHTPAQIGILIAQSDLHGFDDRSAQDAAASVVLGYN